MEEKHRRNDLMIHKYSVKRAQNTSLPSGMRTAELRSLYEFAFLETILIKSPFEDFHCSTVSGEGNKLKHTSIQQKLT